MKKAFQSGDRTFKVTSVRGATRHQFLRNAVVGPLFGSNVLRSPALALKLVRGFWHGLLLQLERLEWDALPDRRSVQYMRNCPPFGVKTDDRAYRCNRSFFCPFCYARVQLMPLFTHVEHFLYGDQHPRSKPVPGYGLLVFRAVRRFDAGGPVCPESVVELAPDVFDALADRRREVDYYRPECAAVLHTVWSGDRHLKLRRSGIMLLSDTPAGLGPLYDGGWKVKMDYHPTANKASLCASASVFGYPAAARRRLVPTRKNNLPRHAVDREGLAMLEWLGLSAKSRMLSTYGTLRRI
jgi:hypothetical protein